jgi:hypothetical protein
MADAFVVRAVGGRVDHGRLYRWRKRRERMRQTPPSTPTRHNADAVKIHHEWAHDDNAIEKVGAHVGVKMGTWRQKARERSGSFDEQLSHLMSRTLSVDDGYVSPASSKVRAQAFLSVERGRQSCLGPRSARLLAARVRCPEVRRGDHVSGRAGAGPVGRGDQARPAGRECSPEEGVGGDEAAEAANSEPTLRRWRQGHPPSGGPLIRPLRAGPLRAGSPPSPPPPVGL